MAKQNKISIGTPVTRSLNNQVLAGICISHVVEKPKGHRTVTVDWGITHRTELVQNLTSHNHD